ncbi:tyrosine--tRNA ligase, partial [Vibrio rotiferianus]
IGNNAISVNGEKVDAENPSLNFPLFDQYWLLQRGKKHFYLVKRIEG